MAFFAHVVSCLISGFLAVVLFEFLYMVEGRAAPPGAVQFVVFLLVSAFVMMASWAVATAVEFTCQTRKPPEKMDEKGGSGGG